MLIGGPQSAWVPLAWDTILEHEAAFFVKINEAMLRVDQSRVLHMYKVPTDNFWEG